MGRFPELGADDSQLSLSLSDLTQGLREGFKWLDVLQGASSPSGGCVSGSRARGSFLPRAFIWVGAAGEGRVLKSGQPAMNYGLCPGT